MYTITNLLDLGTSRKKSTRMLDDLRCIYLALLNYIPAMHGFIGVNKLEENQE